MVDVFNEQLVKQKPSPKDLIFKVLIVVAVLVIFLVSMAVIPGFGVIITAVAGFGAYILLGRLKREYEYIFTNGELDIDVIYNKATRKRVYNGYVKDFEIMAHAEDDSHKSAFAAANETKDYSTGVLSERSYTFLTVYKGKRVAITIEPNDEMLAAITKVLTRRKFHPRKGV